VWTAKIRMVYLTPVGKQEYIEMCLSVTKLEERAKSNRHKPARTSYVGYRNCSIELECKLLERARTHVVMEEAEDAKLLGYTYTPDAVLDCVLIITDDSREDINELKKASELILGKTEGWEKGEERMLGFRLLEFTEVKIRIRLVLQE
ncbi:hypothetical protein Tco_1519244, partial [Tanacetum coccineum]